ncbi:alpha/beta hydrolase [Levilactobacillus bambusae]|uniref:Esterase n=1 Tax=Levilactobacillus bambusae TaxID=2024736 RepID=A0A2V1MZE4_9LACO|nr:hypothetical protein [Levilactobacillus bambusae]PWG00133.1 hypothetical protein DCM90_04145 [Levilactobacillus bambusae]
MNLEYFPGAADQRTLILFHGTNGTTEEMIDFGKRLSPKSPLLAVGTDHQTSMGTQYFAQTWTEQPDATEIERALNELVAELKSITIAHQTLAEAVGVGYSNGASFLLGGIYAQVLPFHRHLLFHPLPVPTSAAETLLTDRVWLSHGQREPHPTMAQFHMMVSSLWERKADVTSLISGGSHMIAPAEVNAAVQWLSN